MDARLEELVARMADWQDRVLYGPTPLDASEAQRCLLDIRKVIEELERSGEMPDGDTLAEVVLAAVALAAGAEDTMSSAAAALQPLAPTEALAGEVAELVALRTTPLTHAAELWARDCEPLPELHSPPADVHEAARGLIDQISALRRVSEGARYLSEAVLWLAPTARAFEAALNECKESLARSPIRSRLWVLHRYAVERNAGDLVPSLIDAVSPALDAGLSFSLATRDQQIAQATARLCKWSARAQVHDVTAAAVHGHLAEPDLDLIRKLIAERPGIWARSHLECLRRNGFTAPVHLVRNENGDGWTAVRVLRVGHAEVESTIPLGWPAASPRQLEAPRVEAAAPAVWDRGPLPPDLPVEGLALARRRLDLPGVDFLLFGDEQGLWALAKNENQIVKARCEATPERATGWDAQFPVIRIGSDVADAKPFRAGPFRPLLGARGENLDRACSPRTYIITVGESCFRNLFKWSLGQTTNRVHRAAMEAGIRSGSELLRALQQHDPLEIPWVRDLRGENGPSLTELLTRIEEREPSALGAEIDTIESITGELKPVGGDHFVLVPTRTATSIIASHIIERRLRARYENASVERVACDAMIQAEDLTSTRHEIPDRAMDVVYRQALALVLRELVDRGADPVLVMSAGLKWEANVILELGADRRVPCVYKSGEDDSEGRINPLALRWDWLRPSVRPRALPSALDDSFEPLSDEQPGRVMLTVGVRLLNSFRSQQRNWQARPDRDELFEWAREQLSVLGERWWTLAPELTAFEAWRRQRASRSVGEIEVALVRSRGRQGEPYVEGQVCGSVIERLLEMRGARVRVYDRWDVLNLKAVREGSGQEQAAQLHDELLVPLRRCIEELDRPDVVFTGGQKLTAALAHLLARQLGCWAFFAPEAPKGAPVLWVAHPKRDPEEVIAAVQAA